jgi:glycolate oxidase FAD binding subunit
VITELTVRTMPVAEETRTIVALGLDDEAAMAAMAAALRSPYEISAAAHLPAAVARTSGVAAVCRPGSSVTALRIEGPAPSVAARVGPVAGLFAGSAPLDCLDPGASAELWREMADASFFAAGEGSPFRDHQVWRLSVPPAAGARTAGAITARTGGQACYDWGGGLVWLALPRCADANAAVVREEVAKTGGHATLVRAEAQVRAAVPVFQPQPPALAALTRRIKDGFDPKRALNPGRMYEGL